MDKHKEKVKEIGILLENQNDVNCRNEGVMSLAETQPDLLNSVYKQISEKLGMDIALEMYRIFKGQQVSFPVRFFNPDRIQQAIVEEYDGTNIKVLAIKYNYSEKTVRRIIKDSVEK